MRHTARLLWLLPVFCAGESHAQASDQELVVVTAGRVEQSIAEAPAAITVITSEAIERTPGDDFGDLIRNVPGVNVSQTSARDINMTSRGSTNTLSNSQLVLLDGRSIYLDFFGIVLWDLLPVQSSEIRQIEVVRGPGSAVWGANAMSGVTNVISQRPKDIVGTTVVVGTPWANVVHAAGDDDFAYKISAGVFEQSAYDRPTGIVPGSNPPQTYPDFANSGTTQRRADARFDGRVIGAHGGLERPWGDAVTIRAGVRVDHFDPGGWTSAAPGDNLDTVWHQWDQSPWLTADQTSVLACTAAL